MDLLLYVYYVPNHRACTDTRKSERGFWAISFVQHTSEAVALSWCWVHLSFLGVFDAPASARPDLSQLSAHSWLGGIYTTAVLLNVVFSLDIVQKPNLYTFVAIVYVALGSTWIITGLVRWASSHAGVGQYL